MTVYRYLFRDSDGDVVRLERAEYADDEIAVLWGARLLKRSQYRDYEVWHRQRLVLRLLRPPRGRYQAARPVPE